MVIGIMLNGKQVRRLVHRLVLDAFIGPCPEGMEACHNNGDRHDNTPSNLRWDTRKNNHADKRKHGTHQQGERIGNAKHTTEQAGAILARYRSLKGTRKEVPKGTYAVLAAEFNTTVRNIAAIASGQNWRHLRDCLVVQA